MMAAMMVVSAAETKAASAQTEAYAWTAIISAPVIRLGSVVDLRSIVSPSRCVTSLHYKV